MAQHHTFWISGCSTCVYQTCTCPWFLFLYYLIYNIIIYIFSKFQEILKSVDTRIFLNIFWNRILSPHYKSFN